MSMAAFKGLIKPIDIIKAWILVWVFNFIGSIFMSWLLIQKVAF